LVVTCGTESAVGYTAASMESLEQEVRDVEERLRTAMLTNDVAALTDLIHDDLVFTGPDGAIVRKQDDLAAHAARRLRLTRLDLQDMSIDVDDLVAKVTVRAILQGTFDGNGCDGTYRYTRTWRKDGGRWQVIAGSVSVEPGG
jgi:ketosteroid isomerase-like protein